MGTPQIIVIVLAALGLGAGLSRHGQPSETNFWLGLLRNAILFGLLYWGGFFA